MNVLNWKSDFLEKEPISGTFDTGGLNLEKSNDCDNRILTRCHPLRLWEDG